MYRLENEGVEYPDCWIVILMPSDISILFVPERTPFFALWMGVYESKEQMLEKFDVDIVMCKYKKLSTYSSPYTHILNKGQRNSPTSLSTTCKQSTLCQEQHFLP